MWQDNETNVDFLNFTGVADTVAEIVARAEGEPISIGVSGAWGVGKSSMINLIRRSLEIRDEGARFVFVEFNAWLYQGYDDVRAALLEIIACVLKTEAEKRKTAVDKATELLKRVDWLRAIRLTAGTAGALALGLPPVGLIGEVYQQGKGLFTSGAGASDVEAMQQTGQEAVREARGMIRPKSDSSPPQAIHAVRECFEGTLKELKVTLVVLIDDLDRCLPETTISTLEAIRLFLFLDHTAFVIAADNEMIKHAVRRHFEGVGEGHITSYFDKLIQVPIRVPSLGTQEVRAYLILLYVQASELETAQQEQIRQKVRDQLSLSWQGKRVDRAFMQSLGMEFPSTLVSRFDAADRLAPLMTTAEGIKGNPRLIKRFLNALSIRMSIAHAQGVDVDEAALTKLLLFERCGDSKAYAALAEAISRDEGGKPTILAQWEEQVNSGQQCELEGPWDGPFVRTWLTVPPRLADLDLRGALYVSREHAPLVMPEDRLSSEGAELLTALLEHPDMAQDLGDRLRSLPRPELSVILDRLLERARQICEWGVPPELEACLAVTRADTSQGNRLAAFLAERPAGQLTAAVVQKISNEPWATVVFSAWKKMDVPRPVEKAMQKLKSNGNVAI